MERILKVAETNPEVIKWDVLSRMYLPKEFIRKHADKVNWENICMFQVLPEDFIREFADKVDWKIISRIQDFSPEFIDEFFDRLDLEIIVKREDIGLSESFIRKHRDRINLNWFDPVIRELIEKSIS